MEIRIKVMEPTRIEDEPTVPAVKIPNGMRAGELVAFQASDHSYRVFRLERNPNDEKYEEENFPYHFEEMFRYVGELPAWIKLS